MLAPGVTSGAEGFDVGLMPPPAKDFTFKDLQREGYDFTVSDERDDVLNADRKIIQLTKDGGKVKDARITFLVVDECDTLVVENFFPNFPKQRKGRGRALLRQLLTGGDYDGYDVISQASDNLKSSFLKMRDFNPVVDDKGSEVYHKVGRGRLQAFETEPRLKRLGEDNPALAEKLKELWFTVNLYGKVPTRR